jgi:ABC-type polysaccharide/polyol phosphate export permease
MMSFQLYGKVMPIITIIVAFTHKKSSNSIHLSSLVLFFLLGVSPPGTAQCSTSRGHAIRCIMATLSFTMMPLLSLTQISYPNAQVKWRMKKVKNLKKIPSKL